MGGDMDGRIFIGGGGGADYAEKQGLLLKYANRHGLIAGGATGTGKTVTLQILAEGFAAQGVPVFLSDVKGDLSGGLAAAGSEGGSSCTTPSRNARAPSGSTIIRITLSR